MAGLGETLRQARAHKNVTLREAEAETRINRHYLAALEDEDLGALPPPIYSRGIVRKYADYLGLDAGKILDMHREATGEPRVISPVSAPVEMPRMWAPNFAILAFGVVLTAIVFAWGYSIWLSPGTDLEITPTVTTTASQNATQTTGDARPTPPAAPTAMVTAPPATEEPAITAGGDNQQSANTEQPMYRTGIGVMVTSEATVRIEVDGQVVLDDVLGAGTETELFVGSDFVVTTSAADATFFKNSCGVTSGKPMSSDGGEFSQSFSAHEGSCPAP